MTKCSEVRCRLCGKNAQEIGGYLSRVSAKGVLPIEMECRPNCSADLPQDARLLLALEPEKTP